MLQTCARRIPRALATTLVSLLIAAGSPAAAFAQEGQSGSGKPPLATYRQQAPGGGLDASRFYRSGQPEASVLQANPVSPRERRLEAERKRRAKDGQGDSVKPKLHTYHNQTQAQGEARPAEPRPVVDGYDTRPRASRSRDQSFERVNEVNPATNGRESQLKANWLPPDP